MYAYPGTILNARASACDVVLLSGVTRRCVPKAQIRKEIRIVTTTVTAENISTSFSTTSNNPIVATVHNGGSRAEWVPQEHNIFLSLLPVFGKDFARIASGIPAKNVHDVVEHYYYMKKKWGGGKLPSNASTTGIDQCSGCLGVFKKMSKCSATAGCEEKLCRACVDLGLWVPLQHFEEVSTSSSSSSSSSSSAPTTTSMSGLFACHKCVAVTMNQSNVVPMLHPNENSGASKRKRPSSEKGASSKRRVHGSGDLWMCTRCTFANRRGSAQCKICFANKPVTGSSRRPSANLSKKRSSDAYGFTPLAPPLKRRNKSTGAFLLYFL